MSRRDRARDRLVAARRRIAAGLVVAVVTVAVVLVIDSAGVAHITGEASAVAVSLLESYGPAALFGAFVLEGLMLLYFAPSESLVPAAIVAFGAQPATIALVLGIALVGATLGQVALFLLVRRAGREFVLEQRFGVDDASLVRFDAWFQKWGPVAIPVSNTFLLVRGMATIPAGLSDMRLRTFAVLSAAGTLCFEVAIAVLTLGLLGAV